MFFVAVNRTRWCGLHIPESSLTITGRAERSSEVRFFTVQKLLLKAYGKPLSLRGFFLCGFLLKYLVGSKIITMFVPIISSL